MGPNHHPRKQEVPWLCLRSHLLTCSDRGVARYQLHSGREEPVLLSHTGGLVGDQKSLGSSGGGEAGPGAWPLSPHDQNLPHGTVGATSQLKSF